MGAVRGALVGALSLIALEVAVTNATGVASLIELVGGDGATKPGLIGHALSPNVPLIADRRTGSSSSSGKQDGIDIPLWPFPGIPLPGAPSVHVPNPFN